MNELNKSTRILSIDTLRGLDMFLISGGSAFFIAIFTFLKCPDLAAQCEHVPWSGFHSHDLIFPLFLFLVGISMPISITKRLEKGDSRKTVFLHVIKRSIILYLLGLVYNGFFDFDFEALRYVGVLPRIAFTYLIAAFIFMNTKKKGQIIWTSVLILGYWLVLLLVPVPGFGAYNLTPEGNLCAYIDQRFLPGSFCCYEFGDNEGLLSNIPAIASVLIGALSGELLLSKITPNKKIKRFLIAGSLMIILALLWSTVCPINKIMWTSPYILLTSGLSLFLICLFYWIIDVKGYTKWTFPFRVYGLNAITIYVAAKIISFSDIAKVFIHGFYTDFGDFKTTFLEFSVLLVKWLFLYFLYRQKIFLKV